MVVNSLGFLFSIYIPVLKLNKTVMLKYQRMQIKTKNSNSKLRTRKEANEQEKIFRQQALYSSKIPQGRNKNSDHHPTTLEKVKWRTWTCILTKL